MFINENRVLGEGDEYLIVAEHNSVYVGSTREFTLGSQMYILKMMKEAGWKPTGYCKDYPNNVGEFSIVGIGFKNPFLINR